MAMRLPRLARTLELALFCPKQRTPITGQIPTERFRSLERELQNESPPRVLSSS
jgi:hypothetical protein